MFPDAAREIAMLPRKRVPLARGLRGLLRLFVSGLLVFLLLSNALFPDWCRCPMMAGMPTRSMSGMMHNGCSMMGMGSHCPMVGMNAHSCSALCALMHAPKATTFGHLFFPAILAWVLAWFPLLLLDFVRLPLGNLLVVWPHPPPPLLAWRAKRGRVVPGRPRGVLHPPKRPRQLGV